MQIRCTQIRPGGTEVVLGGIHYHFRPNEQGHHVCEVADKSHARIFLGVTEAYEAYLPPVGDDEPEVKAPTGKGKAKAASEAPQTGDQEA